MDTVTTRSAVESSKNIFGQVDPVRRLRTRAASLYEVAVEDIRVTIMHSDLGTTFVLLGPLLAATSASIAFRPQNIAYDSISTSEPSPATPESPGEIYSHKAVRKPSGHGTYS